MRVLIYGHTGWIGSYLCNILRKKFITVCHADGRIEQYDRCTQLLTLYEPTHVIIAAGLTGRPNVDWCEDHRDEVLRVNVIGTTVIADECRKLGIHVTYFGTGCIYEYDDDHKMDVFTTTLVENRVDGKSSKSDGKSSKSDGESDGEGNGKSGQVAQWMKDILIEEGQGFVEDDQPNFDGSYYSKTKAWTEKILLEMDNVLILRIRMPLADDLCPRNFITKIINYDKVVDVPNSMTVLEEMLPISIDMMCNGITGCYNFTNPGTISHNQILSLYRQYIDPDYTWTNFTLEQQAEILKAGRSNNKLDCRKLLSLYPNIDHISTAIVKLFERMSVNTSQEH